MLWLDVFNASCPTRGGGEGVGEEKRKNKQRRITGRKVILSGNFGLFVGSGVWSWMGVVDSGDCVSGVTHRRVCVCVCVCVCVGIVSGVCACICVRVYMFMCMCLCVLGGGVSCTLL